MSDALPADERPVDEDPQPETTSTWLTRRRVLLLGAGAMTAGAAAGVGWLATGPARPEPTVADALAVIDRLEAATQISATGKWTPFRIFSHLAQSIELSLEGYPEHNSELFKNTLGATAYSVFRKRGRMRHALDEAIPGAAAIPSEGDVSQALTRLRAAFERFDRFQGELAPHFAYGKLSRSQYAVAHVMHLNNHLLEIDLG